MTVSPNPAQNQVTLSLSPAKDDLSLQLTDLQGNLILKQPCEGQSQLTIETTSLSKGIYLINVLNSQTGQLLQKKIMITSH